MPKHLPAALRALLLVTLTCITFAPPAAAQGRVTGHELSLEGTSEVIPGHTKVLSGIAYEVLGLAQLRPLRRGEIRANLEVGPARRRQTIATGNARTDADGQFVLEIDVPERELLSPVLRVVVGVGRRASREHTFSLRVRAGAEADLLLDRRRYEPGETVHVWMRARSVDGGSPRANLPLQVQIAGPDRGVEGRRTLTTSASGSAAFEFALPDTVAEGTYRVTTSGSVAGSRFSRTQSFVVQRRTVERLFIDVTLEDQIVRPGAALRGQVSVTTPSGTPVVDAEVVLQAASTTTLRTDAQGRVSFSVPAPTYAASDIAPMNLQVRVVHPAHGALAQSAPYTLARARWRIEAHPSAGALVPEVRDRVFVFVADVQGGVAPAGTELRLQGPGIDVRGRLDAHGYADFPISVADDAAGPLQGDDCDGTPAIPVTVEILDDDGQVADLCIPVAPAADVLPQVQSPLVAPGADVRVQVLRRPRARGRAVLLEALQNGRSIAAVRGRGDSLRIRIPTHARGLVTLRARPLAGATELRGVNPSGEPGVAATGTGASVAVLVRPTDAFSLALRAERDTYEIQQRARVLATPTQLDGSGPGPDGAWIAMVARDLAAHGGETDWTVSWLHRQFQEAALLAAPAGDDLRLLQAALAATVTRDTPPQVTRPLIPPPGYEQRSGRSDSLRDPLRMRDELLRFQAAQLMVRLEGVLGGIRSSSDRRGVIAESGGRQRFDAEMLSTLRTRDRIGDGEGKSLGGGLITIGELQQADASFTWDNVARRLARRQLVQLLSALASLTDPDDANAARASAGLPPRRWLGRLVELGMISAPQLIDPWGRPFALRQTRSPVISFSERAPEWELVSPGPDGRLGTGDDVRDPFARVIPEGSPFAQASGEDLLMRQLSVLSPGPQTLQAMIAAFDTVSLAAQDEQRGGIVTALRSEGAPMDDLMPAAEEAEASADFGGIGTIGRGAGGGGSGYGRGMGALRGRRTRAPQVRMASATVAPAPPSVSSALGVRIREDFPATLHVLPIHDLNASGTTALELPLADALTTYRIETIAWTSSGWTVSARTEVRVDQLATVDAPVPPFAVSGDAVRIPVRMENRGNDPISVRVRLSAEGLELEESLGDLVTIPPRRAIERVVELAIGEPGTGHIVVELRDGSGRGLDAVRRPMTVYTSAREIHRELPLLLAPGASHEIQVPDDALPRTTSELRVRAGGEVFGSLEDLRSSLVDSAWAHAMVGEPLSSDEVNAVARILGTSNRSEAAFRAFGAGYTLGFSSVPEDVLRGALERFAQTRGQQAALLLALAPALRMASAETTERQSLHPTLLAFAEERRRELVNEVMAIGEDHTNLQLHWALYALTAIGDTTNARELLRRVAPDIVRVGDEAFVELVPAGGANWQSVPSPQLRVGATVLVAAAVAQLASAGGEREAALPYLRFLHRHLRQLGPRAMPGGVLGVHAWTAARTIVGNTDALPEIEIDGELVQLSDPRQGIASVALPTLSRPGSHRIQVRGDALALATVSIRYGRPWDAAPRRPLRVDLAIEGEAGPRDARAALVLRIHSRSPHLLQRPELQVDLPAGVELDEPTRQALRHYAIGDPTMRGRTLRMRLAPLAPGARRAIPLPLRWAVGGSLRGLGVVLGEGGAAGHEEPPAAILAPIQSPIADEGPEPARPDLDEDDTPPDEGPPIVPLPEGEHLDPVANFLLVSDLEVMA